MRFVCLDLCVKCHPGGAQGRPVRKSKKEGPDGISHISGPSVYSAELPAPACSLLKQKYPPDRICEIYVEKVGVDICFSDTDRARTTTSEITYFSL